MPAPTKQKALALTEKGGQFAVVDRDVPTPNRGELLIKNESIGLNPVDWKIQAYGILVENFPYISGSDGAGVIEAVGDEVTGLTQGDKVYVCPSLMLELPS